MNDYLSTLMQTRAEEIEVPRPDVVRLVSHGRRQRTRRRVGGGVVAAAVVGLMATSVVVAPSMMSPNSYDAAAAAAAYQTGGAYGIGKTLYFGEFGEGHKVEMEDLIRTVQNSKSGVVVSTGRDNFSDGEGASRFWFVSTEGTVTKLPVAGQRHGTTSVDSSYFTYSEAVDGENHVVVLDLITDREVGRLNLGTPGKYGDRNPPEVFMSGDIAYFNKLRPNGVADLVGFDWRSGSVNKIAALNGQGVGYVIAGKAIVEPAFGEDGVVYDIARGKSVLDVADPDDGVDDETYSYASIDVSPGGRYAIVETAVATEVGPGAFNTEDEDRSAVVFDLRTGQQSALSLDVRPSWTPDDHLFYLTDGAVKICDVMTAVCDSEPLPAGANPVLGG